MIRAAIEDRELAEFLAALPADDMVHFTMADGRFRGAFFHGTHLVNQMRAQHSRLWQSAGHSSGILESYVLGQACLCASLLIPAVMKGREHVSWHYEVEGAPAKGFSVARYANNGSAVSPFTSSLANCGNSVPNLSVQN